MRNTTAQYDKYYRVQIAKYDSAIRQVLQGTKLRNTTAQYDKYYRVQIAKYDSAIRQVLLDTTGYKMRDKLSISAQFNY